MENNKRIIFATPDENTTSAQIIFEILKRNGIQNIDEDILDNEENSKWIIVINATKDLFTKKINEAEASTLFQNKLQTSKEAAEKIIADLKKDILPYGKEKVDQPSVDENSQASKKIPAEKNAESSPLDDIISSTNNEIKNNIEAVTEPASTPVKRGRKPLPKTPVTPEQPTQPTSQSTGPDAYREPIE